MSTKPKFCLMFRHKNKEISVAGDGSYEDIE